MWLLSPTPDVLVEMYLIGWGPLDTIERLTDVPRQTLTAEIRRRFHAAEQGDTRSLDELLTSAAEKVGLA